MLKIESVSVILNWNTMTCFALNLEESADGLIFLECHVYQEFKKKIICCSLKIK